LQNPRRLAQHLFVGITEDSSESLVSVDDSKAGPLKAFTSATIIASLASFTIRSNT
jgi:hypothetical protein